MFEPLRSTEKVRVDGKFFHDGTRRFSPKGVTYGPFAPDEQGDCFGAPTQVRADFARIIELGANVLRVYCVPPRWFLDLAAEHRLRLLIDVPWTHHRCFLDHAVTRAAARHAVETAAKTCGAHPTVFALSVANEIAPDIARWSGPKRVAAFIDELIGLAKSIDSSLLCTFGNYPPTEFLRPSRVDFHCFNVYLHDRKPFENYLARLQMIADAKPLVLGEFGVDSVREGEQRQAEILSWNIESAFRSGAAGTFVFSFTDDWFRSGMPVLDWSLGLTERDRTPKPSFDAVRSMYRLAPHFPLPRYRRVSVIVASYQGARTLPACLESVERLNYPAFEILLVDDGSTDCTPEIAARYPSVRYVRLDSNQGLSAARNAGIQAANGEIIAFTDADCRVDEDWLHHLVGDLLNSSFVGIGGHNLLPPDDSAIAAAVMASPGGPAHVLLTDRLAEHIPGCNMAFYKWALEDIGGFDPLFRKAGDDVDVCWRLQRRGYALGFSPGGFVWHYRRSTVRDYLAQQRGYGEAEALLVRRHPEHFNRFGASQWQGRIYSPARTDLITRRPIIYHGVFSSGFFQTLYTGPPAHGLLFLTSLEYHILVTLPLLVCGSVFRGLLPLGIASLAMSAGVCGLAAWRAELPTKTRVWMRPLVACLFGLQPIVRGWARHRGSFSGTRASLDEFESFDSRGLGQSNRELGEIAFWNTVGVERIPFLRAVIRALEEKQWPHKTDPGWSEFDLEIYGSRWCLVRVLSVSDVFGHNRVAIRCRLGTRWSLLSKALCWSLVGLQLITLGLFGDPTPRWFWLLPLLLMGQFIWIRKEQRRMRRVLFVLLRHVAMEVGMVLIHQSALNAQEPNRTHPG